jgi:Fuc2NAc and GlcNAc transferase
VDRRESALTAAALLLVFFASLWLTGRFRRYALAQELVDHPNDRSSHVIATPRGGGVAIVLTTLTALPLLALANRLPWSAVAALVGSGLLIASVGFVDDRGHIAARWRLLGHFAAAAWVLYWLGGLPPLPMFGRTFELGWAGNVLALLYVVWLLNLTNFMDGIDGIAAIEAITVCLGGAGVYLISSAPAATGIGTIVLAAATLGFLCWNWPRARIFMGDAGSGFLGLMLAAFSLQAAWTAPRLLWAWIILLGVFVVDATVTLVRRVARGEKFYEAHRTHAYQHAAQRAGSHLPVTLAVAAINVCWLLPIALLVGRGALDGAVGVIIAYLPLLAAALYFGAGTRCKR